MRKPAEPHIRDRRRTKPSLRKGRLLHVRSGLSAEKTLFVRVAIVAVLLMLVVAVFWFDRDGLKDQIDGTVTFPDILYFAMITVTTVGYGDIVPVSHTARLIDAFAVTPIRIFIWFIFLGTAYELVVQRIVEDFRLSRIQKQLNGHIVLCGFGHSGFIAAQETLAKGHPGDRIVVIDESEDRMHLAAEAGLIGLLGDATSEETLVKACVGQAKAVIVSTGRDDTTILVVLTVRHLSTAAKIVASIKQEENIKLANLSGANLVVSPPKIGGYLMADAVETRHATPFLCDLMSAGGRMVLSERRAEPGEIGRTMAEVPAGIVVQVHSHGRDIAFTERDRYVIQPNDLLLIICQPPPAR
ncbi:potassium channel protein [Azospirillum thiophilum]|uniref:Potassium channel protein n=1 Tax=Azospirillum thiophilum TaxID=528244 RepID=A0A0F2KKY1_9PROT|nr:potassium channel protein [Azospirillum thiophilum]ALG75265.1 potassium channel protein [Azospirillum thiophilum]KJR62181.1 potassium channel protein [Azospirillum thiophilum]KJR62659.1 potassium channel protein [Azospirillum thiophilum]